MNEFTFSRVSRPDLLFIQKWGGVNKLTTDAGFETKNAKSNA